MSFAMLQKTLASGGPEALSATSLKVSQAIIQVLRANEAALEVTADSGASAGEGIELLAPADDVTLASLGLSSSPGTGNTIDLSLLYIMGTSGDGVNVMYETF